MNGSDIDLSSENIHAVVASPGLQGIVLSRTESVDQVEVLKAHLRADVMIVALVETAAGIENAGVSLLLMAFCGSRSDRKTSDVSWGSWARRLPCFMHVRAW